MQGVVFAWPDTYLPSAPTDISGFIESSGSTVWLGNTNGLFHYDGSVWKQESSVVVLALSQSPSGATWALFDTDENPVQRLVASGEHVAEPLAADTHGLDLIAVDEDTVWVLAGTAASHWRDGIHAGELTLYALTADGSTVLSNAPETQLSAPRFARVGDGIYVHDDGGLTQDVYDPLNWLVQAVKPTSSARDVFGTPDGRFLTNDWPELTTFNERVREVVNPQLCNDVVTLDPDAMLCAAYNGGLVRLVTPPGR
jgi:hypothetical protein